MTQTRGSMPALYDGVGAGKKPTKRVTAAPSVKARLAKLAERIKRAKGRG